MTDKDPVELKNKIEREAIRSTSWVTDNKMVCSGEKTKLLIIGTRQQRKKLQNIDMSINVCDNLIKPTKSEKLLGLVVNDEFTWKEYLYGEAWRIDKNENFVGLIPKLSKRIGLLQKLRNKMTNDTFNMIACNQRVSLHQQFYTHFQFLVTCGFKIQTLIELQDLCHSLKKTVEDYK